MKTENKSFLSKFTSQKIFPLLILYVLMLVLFTVWSKLIGANFLQASTVRNIMQSLILSAFLTMGAGILMIGGYLDLSQSAIGAFGAIVMAWMLANAHLPWYLAILISLVLCAVLGACNALLITQFHFPAFIATMAMASIARGFMYLFSSIGSTSGTAVNIYYKDAFLDKLGNGKVAGIPISVIVMLVFFVIYGIIVAKTRFGAKVAMQGGNPVAARLAGINATAITFVLFINSAVMGGVAGVFHSSRLQQGALTALASNQFTGITAAVLGGISFGGGSGGMGGAFVGLLILNTFQIGMSTVGLNPDWVNVFSGILLLVALAFDLISRARQSKVKA